MLWFQIMPDRFDWVDSKHVDTWEKLWEAWDWTGDKVAKVTCAMVGHQPERDQCNRPEHDFCFWCKKSMPGQWKRL